MRRPGQVQIKLQGHRQEYGQVEVKVKGKEKGLEKVKGEGIGQRDSQG